MVDAGIIDRFLDTFSRYIDSGFGLLGSEISHLSSALLTIDVTLAGLAGTRDIWSDAVGTAAATPARRRRTAGALQR